MNLRLYQYNNYFNRTIKPIGDWNEMWNYEVYVEYDVNFNPNDGIMTSHIIGGPMFYEGTADYCLVEDKGKVISRWFVIENKRTRSGQYDVILKRDTVGEYRKAIMSAPCFVEKGWVPDTDPAIFNHENMTFNQIKKSEVLLTDDTWVPWLVGYYQKGNTLESSVPALSENVDYTVNGLANWEYNSYRTEPARTATSFDMSLFFDRANITGDNEVYITITGLSKSGNLLEVAQAEEFAQEGYAYYDISVPRRAEIADKILQKLKSNAKRYFQVCSNMFTDGLVSNTQFANLEGLAGRKIYDSSTGTLYSIEVIKRIGSKDHKPIVNPELTSNFGLEMYNIYSQIDGITGDRPTSNSPYRNFAVGVAMTDTITLNLKIISNKSYSAVINPAASAQTASSPYNIFAIPYGDFVVNFPRDEDYVKMNADMGLRLCMDMISKYSGGTNPVLLDVQIVPYCPIATVRNNMEANSTKPTFLLDNISSDLYTTITTEENVKAGVIFHCANSSHRFAIDRKVEVDNIKISNETEVCRLVSPNWNGMFEFSPAKNYGVDYFTVDYELKPFAPYIHVAPGWNRSGLYGNRDNDPIGLICGGDFGLTMVSDAWSTYERQNKNYQNIFDRQIQNLEVQNKYALGSDIAGAVTGTFTGTTGGAMMGSMIGGGVGMGIGAGVGAVASGIGGIADIGINRALREENMSYTKDMYGYQLGNIKALPQSLTRVSSLNPNNTFFPILEIYQATPEEIRALEQKIAYNGMTIGRIGRIKDYLNPTSTYTYIQGQLIILDNLGEDSHLADDIANEINKGVRI